MKYIRPFEPNLDKVENSAPFLFDASGCKLQIAPLITHISTQ